MAFENGNTYGQKKSNASWQLSVLRLLSTIAAGGGGGADHELVNTDYQAIANGVGYSIGDSITRTLIIDTPTGTVVTTIWWNNTTGLQIIPAPPYADLSQVGASASVTVVNGAGALAVNIQDGGNSITVDATALPLPTGAATEATLLDVKTSVQLLDDCVGTDNTAAPTKSLVVAGVTSGGTQQSIEVNASGHVNIADGGGSITVDGTVAFSNTSIAVTQATAANLNMTEASAAAILAKLTAAAASMVKLEDAVSASGDAGSMILAKRLDTASTQTSTDGDYTTPVANSNGALRVSINRTFQVTDANDLLKAEDSAHVTGDAGVFILAVANEAQSTAFGADGDYTPISVDRKGNVYVTGQDIDNTPQTNTKPISIGGKAVEFSTYAPAYTAADEVMMAFDLTTGRALIQGQVGGFTTLVQSTVVMSVAGAYATGDYMGTTTTPQSFASAVRTTGGTGIIKSLIISDKITTANVAMELWILDRTYTAPTDNAAWDLSDPNMLYVQAVIPISSSGWYASSAGQVYVDGTLSIPIKSNTQALFYALVARGTTPSFTSSDLTITISILQD